jgi:hypothetical protein
MKEGRVDYRIGKGFPLEGELNKPVVIFETEVPVILGNDRANPVGKAKCFRDPESKHLMVEIEFGPAASEDIENVLGMMTMSELSIAGTKHIQGVAYGLT